MSGIDGLSVIQKLLIAAHDLVREGHGTFSAEDLVVAAWKRYPDTFGLPGHYDSDGRPAYPDSNRVFAEIMGSKPIRKRGYLRKVGTKRYELTEAGHAEAKRLAVATPLPHLQKAALPREIEAELRRVMRSRAFLKARDARADDITFFDACSFWAISPRSSAIDLEGRLASIAEVLRQARAVTARGQVSFEHRGNPIGADDVARLQELNQLLLHRFSSELETIRKRDDERA